MFIPVDFFVGGWLFDCSPIVGKQGGECGGDGERLLASRPVPGDILKRVLLVAVGVCLAAGAAFLYVHYPDARSSGDPWNTSAITAQYVGAQVKEVDTSNAVLLLAYDLQNNTNSDFKLADGPGSVVIARNADQSLSSKEEVHFSYGAFLPAHQRARVELQIERRFTWPAEDDPSFQDKLKEFVNQRLVGLDAFVLFDQTDHCQINFPKGWQELKVLSAAAQ